jgi:hypothetical protein
MSNLIKEAIADAKAMREMAVAQAKAALEEAFEPQIHSVITKKIQSEMDGVEEDVELEEDLEETVELQSGHEKAQENSGLTEEDESSEEDESLEEVADTSDIGQGDNKEPSKASSDDSTQDPGGEVDLQSGHEDAKENSGLTENEDLDEDFDLDSVISELEDEAEDYEEEELEYEEPEVEDELGESDIYEDGEEDDDEELDIEVEPEVEDEVDVEPEAEEEFDVEPEAEVEDEEDEDEELDLEGLVDEAEQDYAGRISSLEAQVSSLMGKLGEAIKVVKYQKGKLNEVNILNAKLLFTNKVFRGFNLDTKAKVKVIENFDRAKNVREVKLIYATLMENLAVGEKKENKRTQRLVEGASSVVNSTNSEKKTEPIVDENNEVKSRIHKLMGMKK